MHGVVSLPLFVARVSCVSTLLLFDRETSLQIKAKLKGKQEMCVTQLEDNSQKMQNLGTLPLDQHEQYKASACFCGGVSFPTIRFRRFFFAGDDGV